MPLTTLATALSLVSPNAALFAASFLQAGPPTPPPYNSCSYRPTDSEPRGSQGEIIQPSPANPVGVWSYISDEEGEKIVDLINPCVIDPCASGVTETWSYQNKKFKKTITRTQNQTTTVELVPLFKLFAVLKNTWTTGTVVVEESEMSLVVPTTGTVAPGKRALHFIVWSRSKRKEIRSKLVWNDGVASTKVGVREEVSRTPSGPRVRKGDAESSYDFCTDRWTVAPCVNTPRDCQVLPTPGAGD